MKTPAIILLELISYLDESPIPLLWKMTDTSVTTKQQTVGFDSNIALYDERGWAEVPVYLNRQGDTAYPLIVNVKFSETLNEDAPAAQYPIYNHAVEVHWKAGESGRKEVPVRIKVGSVQIESLYVIARLQIPLGQDVELERGRGTMIVRIDNEHTTDSPDRSAEYIVPRRSAPLNLGASSGSVLPDIKKEREPVEISIAPFVPPAS